MNKSSRRFALRRFRSQLALLLAYLTLVSPLAPVFAQAVKVKRASTPAPAQGTAQPTKGGGTVGVDKHITLPAPNVSAVPVITATKTDNTPLATQVAPGSTITYSVTISNTGGADASNVQFNDTVDPNTSLVAGSVNTQPIAANDSYTAVGNVRIQPNAAQGLLANDIEPDTGNNTGLTASGPTTSTNGGNVTINSDGSFSYDPPAGFAGADTFTYTVTNTGADGIAGNGDDKTDTATVTIQVGNGTTTPGVNVVWFVDPSKPAGGDGRLTHPFNCYTGANVANVSTCFSATAADDPGDAIFLYTGAHTGGNTLLNTQKLIGAGATATLAAIAGLTVPAYSDTLPATGGAAPTITTTAAATNAINLGSSNVLRGFTVGNTTGAKISGTSFGTLAVGDSTSPDVTLNGTGQALNLSTGSFAATSGFNGVTTTSSAAGTPGISLSSVGGTVNFGATSVSNSATQGINISGSGGNFTFGTTTVSSTTTQGILIGTSTGAISFGDTSVTGGTDAVSLQNNSSGSRTFLSLTTLNNSATAFLHGTGGGTTTVTNATSITNPGTRGIDIQNSTTLVTFHNTNVTQSGGTGVFLASNTGNVTFADLDISPDSGQQALNISGTPTGTSSGTITTTNAAAITISASSINLTFDSVSATINAATAASGVALTGATSGSLTMNAGAISGGNASAFSINSGTASVTYNGTISQANAQFVVDVQSKTGGTVAFGGAVSSTGKGVNLVNNAGATINFTGGINLSTGANTAFNATGAGPAATTGGTVNATQNNTTIVNTLTTTTGAALNVVNTTIGASNLNFRSISSNGAASGIVLNNTGATGGLSVLANGGTCTSAASCTGGAIQNSTSHAVSLTSTKNVSIDRMFIQNAAGSGVKGTSSVNGFSFVNGRIDNTGTGGGVDESNIAFNNPPTSATNLIGAVTITGNTLLNSRYHGVDIQQDGGTITSLNISNNTLTSSTTAANSLGSAIHIVEHGTASTAGNINGATINNNTINNFPNGAGVLVQGGNTTAGGPTGTFGSVATPINITGNIPHGQPGVRMGTQGVNMSMDGAGSSVFNISSNNVMDVQGVGVAFSAFGNSVNSGTMNNNTVVSNSNVNGQPGIAVGSDFTNSVNDTPQLTITMDGNATSQTQGNGILALANGHGTLNVTIKNSNIAAPLAGVRQGIVVRSGNNTAGENATVCSDIRTNTSAPSVGQPAAMGIGLRKQGTSTSVNVFGIEGLPAGSTSSPNVENYVSGNNPNGGGVLLVSATSGFSNCSSAPVANLGTDEPPPAFSASATTTPVASAPSVASPTIVLPAATQAKPAKASAQVLAAAQLSAPAVSAETQAPVSKNGDAAKSAKQATPGVRIIQGAGGTVSVNIGTLKAGDSVTITFQVTVDSTFTGANPYVENQGTVSGTGFSSVLTDDPETAAANDKTRTNVLVPPHISVLDAKKGEPATGQANMLFTVVLDHAYPGGVSVNYATADQTATGGASCNGTVDYLTTGGTLVFSSTETFKTISVPVCADTDTAESNETFTLTLSAPTVGTLSRATATGTILPTDAAGTFLISELRTSGPAGAGDDFVELYNNTDAPVTVTASDASAGYGLFKMGTDCNAVPVLIATIPNGTTIPARGHYLVVGSQYSLANYGGTGAAAGNVTMTSDIETDHNVAVFSTADVNNLASTALLDAVGFDGNTGGNVCDLLFEGTTLPPIAASPSNEYSFFRNLATGTPADTNNNAADFFFADTQGTFISGVPQHLGAPGPENLVSPIIRTATIKSALLDATQSSSVSPNRVRDLTTTTCTAGGNATTTCTNGTLSIRRRFINNTGANVTRLRFRVVQVTTFPSPGGGVADVRLLTSTNASATGVNDPTTCTASGAGAPPCTVTVRGTTLETPPAQPNGGGYNSTVAAGTITTGTPLAPGASINVQFLLGVQTTGSFTFFIVVEALP